MAILISLVSTSMEEVLKLTKEIRISNKSRDSNIICLRVSSLTTTTVPKEHHNFNEELTTNVDTTLIKFIKNYRNKNKII
jgi:hypothetical protein